MGWEKEYEHMRDYGHTWGPGLEDDSESSEAKVSETAARRQAYEEKRANLRVKPSDAAVQAGKDLDEMLSGFSGFSTNGGADSYNLLQMHSQEQLNYAKKIARDLGYDLLCCSLKDRDRDGFTVSVEFHGHVPGEGGGIHRFSVVDIDNIKDCLQLVEDFSKLGYWSTTWHKDYHITLKDSGDLRIEMERWGFPLDNGPQSIDEQISNAKANKPVHTVNAVKENLNIER